MVIVGTDKSGKRAVMSKDLYIESMKTHMEGDSEHNREEVVSKEKQFNGPITRLLRFTEMGKNWGHEDRFK